jgi:hypothetical protein
MLLLCFCAGTFLLLLEAGELLAELPELDGVLLVAGQLAGLLLATVAVVAPSLPCAAPTSQYIWNNYLPNKKKGRSREIFLNFIWPVHMD